MNVFIAIMLLFAAAGLADKLCGGKLGLNAGFERGLSSMGGLAMSMVGIYCAGITVVGAHAEGLAALSERLPFDPSLIVGCLLATDMGGYSIAGQMAATREIGLFSGLIAASTLGTTISFALPIAMSSIQPDDTAPMMKGFLLGIVTIPASLVSGGLLVGMPVGDLLVNSAPILVICAVLCLALLKATQATTRALLVLGQVIRTAGCLLFAAVVAGLFVPAWQFVDTALVSEAFLVVVKITAVVCGALVFSQIVMARCKKPISALARLMKVNDFAVVGLLLSVFTSLSMLPLFASMDKRGKVMNAAFTVSGAFALGGQLAFVASVEPAAMVWCYILSKLCGGACAVLAAVFTTPADLEKEDAVLTEAPRAC